MAKIYILEMDLRPVTGFRDIPESFVIELDHSDEISSGDAARDAMKEALISYGAELPECSKLFSKIEKSLDEFLVNFDTKITHSENHDVIGSFTWVSRTSDSRKRLKWPKK